MGDLLQSSEFLSLFDKKKKKRSSHQLILVWSQLSTDRSQLLHAPILVKLTGLQLLSQLTPPQPVFSNEFQVRKTSFRCYNGSSSSILLHVFVMLLKVPFAQLQIKPSVSVLGATCKSLNS